MSDQPNGTDAKAAAPKPVGTRRSGRARRPPRNPNSPAASLADKAAVSDEATKKKQKREREARAKEKKKNIKGDLPRAADPSALVRAAQRPRAPHFLPFFPSIELDTGKPVLDVPDWLNKRAPTDAAAGLCFSGRMIGKVRLEVKCSPELTRSLRAANCVSFQMLSKKPPCVMKTWDQDGEFLSRKGEHILVSRLLTAVQNDKAKCVSPPHATELLQDLYALQSPQSSPWKRPLLRALSTHTAKPEDGGLTVTYYVYASRLLFELIADPAITGLMRGLQPVAHVTPAAKLEEQPTMFVSTRPAGCTPPTSPSYGPFDEHFRPIFSNHSIMPVNSRPTWRVCSRGRDGMATWRTDSSDESSASAAAANAYDFSLAGILKTAESTGYRIVDDQPPDLKVDLFEYQRSSCQWMLDHERDPRGLNGYFWEKREWADGGPPLYYFPLAGEFRLTEPPHITGGLLCEEMGLGKTMEVLSTILSNKREGGQLGMPEERKLLQERNAYLCKDAEHRVVSRATLIVVPVSLAGQWSEEIRKNVREGAIRVMTLAGPMYCEVPLSSVEVIGTAVPLHVVGRHSTGRQTIACHAPYLAPGETPNENSWRIKGTVEMTNDQIRRLDAIKGSKWTRSRVGSSGACSGSGAVSGAGVGGGVSGQEETLRVLFKADEWMVSDNDVVLTTYEMLRSRPALFRKINFHRCVLDECQEIKTATTNIAKMCQQVQATHRWMVSGTPLSSKIDDLHGELNFLQVWPFSLQNDGFWEKKIGEPFAKKDREALNLLRALIKVVMMRHSKSQTYADGTPLVRIPERTVEWRGIDFARSQADATNVHAPHARYVYKFLERLCSKVCQELERGSGGGEGMGRRDFAKLKTLLHLMQKAATHPGLVGLSQLDNLQRSIHPVVLPQMGWGHGLIGDMSMGDMPWMGSSAQLHAVAQQAGRAQAAEIQLLPAEEVLRRLAQAGAGKAGGMNRDVGRQWAVGGEEEMRLRHSLEGLAMTDLRRRLSDEGLPLPRSWAVLKPRADIATGSKELVFGAGGSTEDADDGGGGQEVDDDGDGTNGPTTGFGFEGKGKGKGKRKLSARVGGNVDEGADIRKLLKVTDTIRVGLNAEDNEASVEALTEGTATLATKWVMGSIKAGRVYRFSMSSRKKPYIDLLVAMNKASKSTEVHEAGFSTIYKAMAGDKVSCPICMCQIVRPTVTKCSHMFCRDCISRELERVASNTMTHAPKCPICRRPTKGSEMMEIQTQNEVEEATALDTVSSGGERTFSPDSPSSSSPSTSGGDDVRDLAGGGAAGSSETSSGSANGGSGNSISGKRSAEMALETPQATGADSTWSARGQGVMDRIKAAVAEMRAPTVTGSGESSSSVVADSGSSAGGTGSAAGADAGTAAVAASATERFSLSPRPSAVRAFSPPPSAPTACANDAIAGVSTATTAGSSTAPAATPGPSEPPSAGSEAPGGTVSTTRLPSDVFRLSSASGSSTPSTAHRSVGADTTMSSAVSSRDDSGSSTAGPGDGEGRGSSPRRPSLLSHLASQRWEFPRLVPSATPTSPGSGGGSAAAVDRFSLSSGSAAAPADDSSADVESGGALSSAFRFGTEGRPLGLDASPNLVIPHFWFTAAATESDLIPAPPIPPQELARGRDNSVPSLSPTFLRQYYSATPEEANSNPSSVKLDAMLSDMHEVLSGDVSSKFVVFTQYTQVVERASSILQSRGYRTVTVVGTRSRVERSNAVASFTNDPSIKVILLTTGSAAAGLTLTAASTVYMLDPVWSAADEAQALNRAHRIGQTHTVRCIVFYMRDSVEERMLALRHSKGNFAQFLENADSVTGMAGEEAGGSFINVFALPELKRLFGLLGTNAPMSHGNAEDGAAGGLPGVPNNRWGNNPFVYTTSEEEDGEEDGFSDSDLSDGDIFVEGLTRSDSDERGGGAASPVDLT